MPWGAAIAAAGEIGGSILQGNAAEKAAEEQIRSAERGREEYRQYNQPYYDAGTSSLTRLERLNAGDFSAFTESPDYQFALQQGNQQLLRSAASRGALNAGATDLDLINYGQGLASQQYGNYYNRLASLAAMGQSSAQGLGGSASNAANAIGQAQAGSTINQANAYSNALGGLAQLGGQYFAQNQANQSTYANADIGPVTRQVPLESAPITF